VDECSILIAGGRATTAATNETHTHTRTYAQRGERRGGGKGEKNMENRKKSTPVRGLKQGGYGVSEECRTSRKDSQPTLVSSPSQPCKVSSQVWVPLQL
jgi:hypothetical protein